MSINVCLRLGNNSLESLADWFGTVITIARINVVSCPTQLLIATPHAQLISVEETSCNCTSIKYHLRYRKAQFYYKYKYILWIPKI